MVPKLKIDLANVVRGFHALSDSTRLEVIELLRGGELCVCELMDVLDVAQSRLSFHLRVLKDAGLVSDRREGRWVYYTLNSETVSELEAYLVGLQTSLAIPSGANVSGACCT